MGQLHPVDEEAAEIRRRLAEFRVNGCIGTGLMYATRNISLYERSAPESWSKIICGVPSPSSS